MASRDGRRSKEEGACLVELRRHQGSWLYFQPLAPCSCCPSEVSLSLLAQVPVASFRLCCALSCLCPWFWSDRDWLLASPLTQPLSWYFSVMACLRSFGWCWHSRPTGFECNGLIIVLNLKCMLFEVTQHNWRTNEPCVPRWLFHE